LAALRAIIVSFDDRPVTSRWRFGDALGEALAQRAVLPGFQTGRQPRGGTNGVGRRLSQRDAMLSD